MAETASDTPDSAANTVTGTGDDIENVEDIEDLDAAAGHLAIVARGLSRSHGPRSGLHELDLDVERGTILGLIGPSGSGKTTLLRALAGISAPTGGDVRVLGRAPTSFTAADRARIGYLPQLPMLFPNLSVWRNLNFVASLYGVGPHRRGRLKALLRFVDLAGDRRKRFHACSGGMQRRLALAAALVHEPDLLLLDEPTAGLDPILRERFWEHFRALRDEGRTLVVSTQHVDEAAMCDRVALLAEGRLVTVGTPAELRRSAFGADAADRSYDEAFVELIEDNR